MYTSHCCVLERCGVQDTHVLCMQIPERSWVLWNQNARSGTTKLGSLLVSFRLFCWIGFRHTLEFGQYEAVSASFWARQASRVFASHWFPYHMAWDPMAWDPMAWDPMASYHWFPYRWFPYHWFPYHWLPYHWFPYHMAWDSLAWDPMAWEPTAWLRYGRPWWRYGRPW